MGTLINETTRTQLREIRAHLETYGWIDKPKALEICDCERLGARIWDLRHDPAAPMNIKTERVTGKNRFGHPETHAIYKLVKENETA